MSKKYLLWWISLIFCYTHFYARKYQHAHTMQHKVNFKQSLVGLDN